jgi:hypothetical protein
LDDEWGDRAAHGAEVQLALRLLLFLHFGWELDGADGLGGAFGVFGLEALFVLDVGFGFGGRLALAHTLLHYVLFRTGNQTLATHIAVVAFAVLLGTRQPACSLTAPILLLCLSLVQTLFIVVLLLLLIAVSELLTTFLSILVFIFIRLIRVIIILIIIIIFLLLVSRGWDFARTQNKFINGYNSFMDIESH